jgi:hypothetical protein
MLKTYLERVFILIKRCNGIMAQGLNIAKVKPQRLNGRVMQENNLKTLRIKFI